MCSGGFRSKTRIYKNCITAAIARIKTYHLAAHNSVSIILICIFRVQQYTFIFEPNSENTLYVRLLTNYVPFPFYYPMRCLVSKTFYLFILLTSWSQPGLLLAFFW